MSRCPKLRVLLLVAAGLVLSTSPRTALAGESKTFADKNLKWTLPDTGKWSFKPLNDNQKKNFYVATALGDEVGTVMDLLVRPDNGLAPEAFLQEIQKFADSLLPDRKSAGSFAGTLSGHKAKCAYAYGSNQQGTELHVSMYVLAHDGQLYALIVRAFQGAHKKVYKVLDEAKRGIRLIKGAGSAESPASGPVPESGGEGGALPTGNTELTPDKWPAKGAKWEEGTVVFPTQNIRWKLPAETPFKVVFVLDDETALQRRQIVFKQSTGEGDKEARCEVSLVCYERDPGYTVQAQVKSDNYQEQVTKQFHQRLPGGVTLEEDVSHGDLTAARFGLKGKTKEGAYETITDTWIALRARIYQLRVKTHGPRDSEDGFAAAVRALIAGFGFANVEEPVAGPFAGAVPFAVMPRGTHLTKEKVLKAPGIEFEKPAGFGRLTGGQGQGFNFAVETRTEDAQSYLYVDVSSHETATLNQNGITDEKLIQDRATAWETRAKGPYSLGKRAKDGKPEILKVKWGKAKGRGYRFEVNLLETPFVERGYVVRHKQRTYFIRVQYGGVDAEKTFKKTVKSVIKNWSWMKK